MTWLIEDNSGELHEVLPDERILVLSHTVAEAHHWLRQQGIPPYGRHVTIASSCNSRVLTGGRWDVYVFLPTYLASSSLPGAVQVLLRNDSKLRREPLRIHA